VGRDGCLRDNVGGSGAGRRNSHLEHPQRAATASGVLQIHQAHVDGRERVIRALVLHHEIVQAELALSVCGGQSVGYVGPVMDAEVQRSGARAAHHLCIAKPLP
jgi:hypothetical protein